MTADNPDSASVSLNRWQSSVSRDTAIAAWEYFVSTGSFPEKTPRSVICQSWLRSRELGVDPNAERATTVLSLDEIEERLRREELGQAGLPVIKQLFQKFDGSEHVLVLADNSGCILYSVGHREVKGHLDQINFMPGGNWKEEAVGPNGVGTPLALQRPEVVMGHEHYCRGWQPWVCYGAPIMDANGKEIIGVIDITGPVNRASPETLILSMSVAQSIQYGLNVLNIYSREHLRLLSKDIIHRWSDNAVILIDEAGFVIDYNSRVQRFLKEQPNGIMERPLSELIPGIWDVVHSRIGDNACGEISVDLKGDFGIKRPVQIHIEPVYRDDRCYGAVLVLSGNSICRADTRLHKQKVDPQSKYTFDHIRGESTALKKAVKLARAAALDPLENSVLLIGETGTGKELVAHSIHSDSNRNKEPFIVVNCSALPRDLVESELFGYVAGAFTGARREGMMGKFEAAQGGTLFLDEIDSLDVALQGKFLRVLDNQEITRLGSHDSLPVNVRVIAAASRDIFSNMDDGKFRLDLYHRLSVIEIPVPALRDRENDVIDLANSFLEEECWYANRNKLILSNAVIPFLKNYGWPGNVRELHNLCLRWVLIVEDRVIRPEHLPDKINKPVTREQYSSHAVAPQENLKAMNDEVIAQVLEQTGGNVSRAAKILGINRTTIYRRQRKQSAR